MTKRSARIFRLLVLFFLLGSSLAGVGSVQAQGGLSVEVIAGYNLVVDSNATSTSTYAPQVATIIGRFCNNSSATLENVYGYIGDRALNTPGLYPVLDTDDLLPGHPLIGTALENTGKYSFLHVGGRLGVADAKRTMGSLAPGECKVQYWHMRYPQCMNEGSPPEWTDPPCSVPTWGLSVKPEDDLALTLDVWATADGVPAAGAARTMTMRNEISAMANKIQPNPDGEWFNTTGDIVLPGETITSNGILYELGLVRHGFDNDGDFRPDYNAWLQPVGDAGYDPSCFRLIHTTGVLTVTRSGGMPDLIITFDDQNDPPSNRPQYGGPLYFTNLPEDNTGVRGEVFYTFLALDGPCATSLSPYQEVASGFDNEKFNGDYGTGLPPLGSTEPKVTIDKSASPNTIPLGQTTTYHIPFANTGTAGAGLTMSSGGVDMPLVLRDVVPDGTEYQCGSSTYALAYAPNSGVTMRYSTNSGSTWSTTEPCAAPDHLLSSGPDNLVIVEWWLNDPLPAGSSGSSAGLTVRVPDGSGTSPAYGSAYVENCAKAGYDSAAPFAEACATILIEGSNSIGNYVWRDENRNGVQDDGAAAGIEGGTLALYLDQGTVGVLDDADVLLLTQETSGTGDGNYLFDRLPDGNYLVVVNGDDEDIPAGYVVTTSTVHSVTGLTGATDYLAADFGFGPILTLDKGLESSNPSTEGDQVLYEIAITNHRAGDGNPPGPCLYTAWGNSAVTGTGGQAWLNAANAQGAPDDLYATAPFQGNAEDLMLTGFDLGTASGNIVKVEALVPMRVVPNLAGSLDLEIVDAVGNLLGVTHQADASTLSDGLYVVDVTGAKTWAWSDFSGGSTSTSIRLIARKTSNPSGDLLVDAVGYRISTGATCGNPSDTIAFLPLTDTFDPAKLTFLSAQPPATSVSGGTITWDNVGPIYAGQTKEIVVHFLAKEPADTDLPPDGEPDPTSHENCAASGGGLFADGAAANGAGDCVTHDIYPGGEIGDLVWYNANNNQQQDAGEPGLSGVVVRLVTNCGADTCYDGDETVLKTTSTDTNGAYLFTGVPAGTYYAVVDPATLPNAATVAWSNNYDDNCIGPCSTTSDHTSGPVTIDYSDGNPANDDYYGADFGYRTPGDPMIVGKVWHDRNNSATATPDAGEEGLAGVAVYLQSGNCNLPPVTNNVCPFTTTDQNGDFVFTSLADNRAYNVFAWTQSGPLLLGTWSQTFDTNGLGTPNISAVNGGANLVDGQIYRVDFSYRNTQSLDIGDTLYEDWNGDGTQGAGEGGIPGVSVHLYRDVNGDGLAGPEDILLATDVTDANGTYLFSGQPGGTDYVVVVDQATLDDRYVQTDDPNEAGRCVTCDSRSALLNVYATNLDQDFGYQPLGSGAIGDYVWRDDDGDGIQDAGEPPVPNVGVSLYVWNDDGDGIVEDGEQGALIATQDTDAEGRYLFSALPAGKFLVSVDTLDPDLPADRETGKYFVLSTSYDHDGDSHTPRVPNDPMGVDLGQGERYLDADFGFAAGGLIGDYVWRDDDGDGIQDPTERPIEGIDVWLYSDPNGDGDPADGLLLGTETTDSLGLYQFDGLDGGSYGLPAGNYVVVVDTSDLPAGYVQTGDPDLTSPCSGGTCDSRSALYLYAGQIDRLRDFGYQSPGVIGQTLWIDADGDGVRDEGESGIPYVTVELWDGICYPGDGCETTETDSDGYYAFGGLDIQNHAYTVVVHGPGHPFSDPDFPAGLVLTYDPDETNGCSTCDGQGSTTLTPAAPRDMNQNFGYRYVGPNSIRGTAYGDVNNNALQDPAETTTYPGVTVYLWNSSHQLVATTLTDASGDYAFTGLPDGVFTVSVNSGSDPVSLLNPTVIAAPTTYYTEDLDSAGVDPLAVDRIDRDFGFLGVPPTGLTLVSLTAAGRPGAVVVAWETANERDLLGFNLFRAGSPDGPRLQLNDALIAGGLPGSLLGQLYSFTDTTVAPGADLYYWLEIVHIDGSIETAGPVSVQAWSGTLYHLYLPVAHK